MTVRRWNLTVASLALVLLGAALTVTVPLSRAARADGAIEAQVMAKIRNYHQGRLIHHAGLYAVARAHSMQMSREGRMSHDNADRRITNAPPDPFETNGAPDDGVPVAAWCENVTYSTGHPESEVAQRLFGQWAGAGAHGRCMKDGKRNVGAIGVYFDGTTWWATFIATTDNTPPGGGAAPTKTAAPKPVATQAPPKEQEQPQASAPAQQQDPQPAASSRAEQPVAAPVASVSPRESVPPSASPVSLDEEAERPVVPQTRTDVLRPSGDVPITRTSATPAYGWREFAAVFALIMFASIVAAFRMRRRRPVYEPQPAVLPPLEDLPDLEPQRERELVGV